VIEDNANSSIPTMDKLRSRLDYLLFNSTHQDGVATPASSAATRSARGIPLAVARHQDMISYCECKSMNRLMRARTNTHPGMVLGIYHSQFPISARNSAS